MNLISFRVSRIVLMSLLCAAMLTLALILPFHLANAQSMSAEDIRDRVASLLEQVAELQSAMQNLRQTSGSSGGSTACSYVWSRNLRVGDEGEDVRQLQQFLNHMGITIANSGPGSPGNESNYYGPLTGQAVARFQERYRQEILSPNGLSAGTTFFGPSTRTHMMIMCRNGASVSNGSNTDTDDSTERREAWKDIQDAKDAINDLEDLIDEAEESDERDEAEEELEAAEDMYRDAIEAFKDDDYEDASDFAKEAEDLAEEAYDDYEPLLEESSEEETQTEGSTQVNTNQKFDVSFLFPRTVTGHYYNDQVRITWNPEALGPDESLHVVMRSGKDNSPILSRILTNVLADGQYDFTIPNALSTCNQFFNDALSTCNEYAPGSFYFEVVRYTPKNGCYGYCGASAPKPFIVDSFNSRLFWINGGSSYSPKTTVQSSAAASTR